MITSARTSTTWYGNQRWLIFVFRTIEGSMLRLNALTCCLGGSERTRAYFLAGFVGSHRCRCVLSAANPRLSFLNRGAKGLAPQVWAVVLEMQTANARSGVFYAVTALVVHFTGSQILEWHACIRSV